MPSPRIALIVGHTKKRQGAKSYLGVHEWEFNNDVAIEALHDLLIKYSINTQIFRRNEGHYHVSLQDTHDEIAAWDADIAVELHFNAFDGRTKVLGAQCLLVDANPIEKLFADHFFTYLKKEYGIKRRGRGTKHLNPNNSGYYNIKGLKLHSRVTCCALLEPCFGDTANRDSKLILENPTRYGRFLAQMLADFVEG